MRPSYSLPRFAPWLIINLWVRAIAAYTVFEPECTQLKEPANFVSSPNSRGTLEILWSSLFTIFACTWTIQHPNVPEQRDGRFPGWWGDLCWGLRHAVEALKLAITTILVPEIVICIAWCDRAAARDVCSRLKQLAEEDNVPWTTTHGHYAVMGGFIIRIKKPVNDDPTYRAPYHLTGRNLCYLREEGYIRLPHVTEEELADKSKSDPFLKTVALGQILWSIVQIIERKVRGLSISLLELSVLAFAACALIVYVLYWKKPKNANTTIEVREFNGDIPESVWPQLGGVWSPIWELFVSHMWAKRRVKRSKGKPLPTLTYVTKDGINDTCMDVWGTVLLLGGAMVFGAIHVAGWNFFFPTHTELILWRCASVFTATVCIIWSVIAGIQKASVKLLILGRHLNGLANLVTPFLCGLYILARLVIVVETFRTLVYLPLDAFESTWTSSIPHFS